jgi:hypothetical protein
MAVACRERGWVGGIIGGIWGRIASERRMSFRSDPLYLHVASFAVKTCERHLILAYLPLTFVVNDEHSAYLRLRL